MGKIVLGDGHANDEEKNVPTPEADDDELVTPEVNEEKETPAEASPAEKPDEDDEVDGDATPITSVVESSNAKPEITEEDRLAALKSEQERVRKEISELRAERRRAREEIKTDAPLILDRKADELADVADSDVQLIEKVLRAKGYVKKDELRTMTYAERLETHKDSWLEKHPEYLPANDPEDERWKALKAELDQYKSPANPQDIVKILDRAHSYLSPRATTPVKTKATTLAQQEKIKSTSASQGGGTAPADKQKKSIDKNFLKGFSDEELQELLT